MATYDLAYPGAAIDAILNTAYFLQEAGYIFQGSASEYSGTPSKRVWLIAPAGFTGFGLSSAVPQGSIGVCLYNGTAWVGKVINVLTLDSAPTRNSQNGVTSGGVAATLDEIAGGIMATFASLLFDDETAAADLSTKLSYAVKFSVSDVYQTVTHLNILAATTSKAGLMSAEDKAKVDSFLTNLRSLTFTDTTASADQGTQITETLKATIGGVQEVIDSITLLAATSSKAGLLSASDKAYIDALPASLTNLSNSIQSIIDNYAECLAAQENGDLYLTDENGNAIAVFEDGHIKTKNFDSSNINLDQDFFLSNYDNGDFGISDELGYVLLSLANGNISVKNFTSAPLKGKKVSFLGDSITTYANYPGSNNPFYTGSNAGVTSVNQTWWKSLCDRQGATLNRIYAYGGGNLINRLCLQYNNLYSNGTSGNAPDVVFILAGINDWYNNKALGTIADEENSNTTFYAAYKYLLKNLKETYPNAQIIGLTMLNSMIKGTTVPYLNTNNVSIRDFCKAVMECCDYYSVPSIDLNKIVNINGGNYTELLADYTHPNITGIGMMTKAIINNIHNVIYY